MKLKLYFLSFLLVACFKVSSQGLCDIGGGGFEVTPMEGCAPLTVSIKNNVGNTAFLGYTPAYNGSSTDQNTAFRNYTEIVYPAVGSFTLLQYGILSSGIKFSECKRIRVYEAGLLTAQYSSCGGGKVRLTLTDNAMLRVYDEAEILWGDNNSVVWKKGDDLVFEHTYTDTSSPPTIRIRGIYTTNTSCSGGATLSLPVSFQQAQLGTISIKSVEMRGNGTIRLSYQGVTAIPTAIQYSSGSANFVTAGSRSSGGVQPYDINGLNSSQSYKIRLSSEDLCGSLLTTEPVTSMVLSGKSEDGKNVLTWNKYDNPNGFTEYELLRDGTSLRTFTSIDDITYTDEDVECGSFSEYQLVAKVNGITSASAPVGMMAEISAANPIQFASVTVNGNNNVTISAVVPGSGPNTTYDLSIEKAESGSTAFKKITTLYNDNQYTDLDVNTDALSYCYRFSYQNSCGQKLDATEPICTIFLKREFINLTWSADKPLLPNVVSYDVIQQGSSGASEEINVQLKNTYTPTFNTQSDLAFTFQIRANSSNTNFQSFSNIVNINRNSDIFVPDAFSPNGDGTNDILEAKAELLQSFNLSVFNRWGQVVFYTDDITKGWDGTINGANAPVGSYIYKLKALDVINQTVEKKGTFMLFR